MFTNSKSTKTCLHPGEDVPGGWTKKPSGDAVSLTIGLISLEKCLCLQLPLSLKAPCLGFPFIPVVLSPFGLMNQFSNSTLVLYWDVAFRNYPSPWTSRITLRCPNRCFALRLLQKCFAQVRGTYNSDFSGLNISEAVFLVNLQMWFELGRFFCSHCYTDPVVSTISCGLMNLGLCCLCSSIPRIQIFLLQSLCEFISRSSMVST